MPIYEYICGDCGTAFEELVRSIHAAPEVVCPGCGSREAERKPSVIAATERSVTPDIPRGACGRCGDPNGPCSVR